MNVERFSIAIEYAASDLDKAEAGGTGHVIVLVRQFQRAIATATGAWLISPIDSGGGRDRPPADGSPDGGNRTARRLDDYLAHAFYPGRKSKIELAFYSELIPISYVRPGPQLSFGGAIDSPLPARRHGRIGDLFVFDHGPQSRRTGQIRTGLLIRIWPTIYARDTPIPSVPRHERHRLVYAFAQSSGRDRQLLSQSHSVRKGRDLCGLSYGPLMWNLQVQGKNSSGRKAAEECLQPARTSCVLGRSRGLFSRLGSTDEIRLPAGRHDRTLARWKPTIMSRLPALFRALGLPLWAITPLPPHPCKRWNVMHGLTDNVLKRLCAFRIVNRCAGPGTDWPTLEAEIARCWASSKPGPASAAAKASWRAVHAEIARAKNQLRKPATCGCMRHWAELRAAHRPFMKHWRCGLAGDLGVPSFVRAAAHLPGMQGGS